MTEPLCAEKQRLLENRSSDAPWHRWGPYLSERQWGTVREDYSPEGDAWNYFTHDQARSRAYRWGEDGLAGLCNRSGEVCFALAFWNGTDPILKERCFGLSNSEGNHGEDVKEYFFYTDNTPSHSYMKWQYKYPQQAYPYQELVKVNHERTREDPEYELLDTGAFAGNKYFDVTVEYAKASADDICIHVHISNRGDQSAPIHVLPTVWFRNTWSWSAKSAPGVISKAADNALKLEHPTCGQRWLYCAPLESRSIPFLFTNNETNNERLFGSKNITPYVKDAFHTYLIEKKIDAINPAQIGTKAAALYELRIGPGETVTLQMRFADHSLTTPFNEEFLTTLNHRKMEADAYFQSLFPTLSPDERLIQRQAIASLLWSKQFYAYDVHRWLYGDQGEPTPPTERLNGRNNHWKMFVAKDIISMPDKWEYPWFAAWDWAFHCVSMSLIDTQFAKDQLLLLVSDNYLNLNGQMPAYEWSFSDVNPPVQAWAAWKVYLEEKRKTGQGDLVFLETVYQQLIGNYYWWINRQDKNDNGLFQGGFLGLDNIAIFNRSKPLPTGGFLEQADGTTWMGFFTLNMLWICLELSENNELYEKVALRFLQQFLNIASAINGAGNDNALSLWDEASGFFFSALSLPDGQQELMKVYSLVGLSPLLAVMTVLPQHLDKFPTLREGMDWLRGNRTDLIDNVALSPVDLKEQCHLLALVKPDQLTAILKHLLHEDEFLSPYGIRSISRVHLDQPYSLNVGGVSYSINYEPAESTTDAFGGNSNWRGPIWFPMNYLLIESLQRFYRYLGDDYKVECPTGSGQWMSLKEVAQDLSQRLISIFKPTADGRRPVYGDLTPFQTNPHWRDLLLFHEYFHGDNGAGLGASHQAGWTALVINLISQMNDPDFYTDLPKVSFF